MIKYFDHDFIFLDDFIFFPIHVNANWILSEKQTEARKRYKIFLKKKKNKNC